MNGLSTRTFGAIPLLLGFWVLACGGEDGEESDGGGAQGATGGALTGGASASGGLPGTGGAAVGSGGGGATGGTVGTGGTAATGGSTQDGGAGGGEACTPPSPGDFTYTGTCVQADLCNDQYDTVFGAATLEQLCTEQGGTWSTTPCTPSDWAMRCWQEVFGGLYVLHMPSDGLCAVGCEEPL